MMRALLKTGERTGRFLTSALTWQPRDREYAMVAWALVAGAVWSTIGLSGGSIEEAVAGLYLLFVLSAVCAIDARYGIIPNSIVVGLAGGGIAQVAFGDSAAITTRLIEAVLVLVAAYLFRTLYRCLRGFDGLGLGDVKFLGASVLWVGAEGVPVLLLVSVCSAVASLAILKLNGEELHGQRAISFGPHLAVGVWWVWAGSPFQ